MRLFAGVGEALRPGLVVEVLRHPEPPAIVPAERHRLRDHRLGGPGIDLVAGDDGHLRDAACSGVRNVRVAPFLLRDAPTARRSNRSTGCRCNSVHALVISTSLSAPV